MEPHSHCLNIASVYTSFKACWRYALLLQAETNHYWLVELADLSSRCNCNNW